jgi:hypothetical protein
MDSYRLIIGKISPLQSSPLSIVVAPGAPAGTLTEQAKFDAAFARIVAKMKALDPEIGASFEGEHDFYSYCAAVAKAYFTTMNIPFEPEEPTSGTFGMRELLPMDLVPPPFTSANPATSGFHTWKQTVALAAGTSWTDLFGTLGAAEKPSNVMSYHSLLGFHQMISWQPATRIRQLRHNVNGYQYPAVTVEQNSKVDKPFKNFKLIPLEGEFLIHPTGFWNTRAEFEKENYANAESYTEQLALLGICFAEYGYLNTELI